MKTQRRLKESFYRRSIAERITVVVSVLMVVAVIGFISSLYIILRNSQTREQAITIEKDMDIALEKMDMFFEVVESDAVAVLVSENCQKLLSDSRTLFQDDVVARHQKYKILRDLINSYIGQKSAYGTIAFYDLYGNCYVSEQLETDSQSFREQQKKASDFLSSGSRKFVTGLHQSPWKKPNAGSFGSCISYFRKIYGLTSGRLIGMIEIEIPVNTLVGLYSTVMDDYVQIDFAKNGWIIVSPDEDMLYQQLADENWYDEAKLGALSGNEFLTLETRSAWYFLKNWPAQDWLMISRVQKTRYLMTIRNYILILLCLAALLLAGAILLVSFLIRSITKPISKITATVTEIGQGDYSRRVSVMDGGEIGILASEFNRMLDRIQSLMEEIVQKEKVKREAEMAMLQLQMAPHFFYNIMESIVGLIYMDEKKTAVRTIQYLSGFYRGVLNHGREIIPVSQELEIARNYLEIMKICHPDKFDYEISCEEKAADCPISKLSLQPILENSIHHGFQDMETGGRIRIRACLRDEMVQVDIEDNGRGIDRSARENVMNEENEGFRMESFGLRNTDDRIKLYFGESYGIRILDAPEGTWIQIRLPGKATEAAVSDRIYEETAGDAFSSAELSFNQTAAKNQHTDLRR